MNQADYFRTHPPRCIAKFTATPAELPDVVFDGNDEPFNSIFALTCRCGSGKFAVHGYRSVDPETGNAHLLSPLAAECSGCGKKSALFDAAKHGHDGELGQSIQSKLKGDSVVDDCGECGGFAMELFARFAHPSDLFDGNYADFAGREQDLFTWFSLVGRCCSCTQTLAIADAKCG
jgi:hypothetical protein